MKKLMFATALGVSVVGFGTMAAPETYNATSFEDYSGSSILSDKGDLLSPAYFCYTDGDADGSLVKTFGGENLAAPSIRRPYYWSTNTTNNKYLELSTEGGILWRSINTIGGSANAYTPGTAQPVADAGTYLDTLVQFTPTEDGGAPTLDSQDKLAIWLNVDSNGVTNLMVQAGWVDAMATPVASNFVLTGTSVVAGEWHRLTVKAVPNIIDTEGAYGSFYNIPAFIIYVDGIEMAATTSPIDATLADLDGVIASGFATLVAANKVFPSIVPPESGVAYALKGVGFKGSGALDDIVWTTEDPFANAGGDDAWIATVTEIFDGANLDAAEKAKITEWASGNSIVVDTTVEGQAEIAAAAYLLGLEDLPDAIPELTITAIEEGEDANDNPAWILTVAASVTTSGTTTDLELPTTINGAITLTQAGTLAGLATATPTTTGFTATVDETVTVTVPKTQAAAAFMKVGVGLAPAAPPANSGN